MFKRTGERRNSQGKLLLLIPLAILTLTAMPTPAQSAHFISTSASGPNGDGELVVSFKEAGLGDAGTVTYTTNAEATAIYACLNGGGNHPKATNKETVNGPVSATGTFPVTKNGSISQSLTLDPPGAGDFSCPSGQSLVLAEVSYSDISIEDTTNDLIDDLPGVFARVFFKL